jgi:hypothetical protein
MRVTTTTTHGSFLACLLACFLPSPFPMGPVRMMGYSRCHKVCPANYDGRYSLPLLFSHTAPKCTHKQPPTPPPLIPLNHKCTHLGIPLILNCLGGVLGVVVVVVGVRGGGGGAKMNLVSTNPRDFKQQHTSVLA